MDIWSRAVFRPSRASKKCLMDHSSVTAVSKNVGESDKEPRKIMRLTATKSHLIKLVYSLGEGAIKIWYRKLQVVLRFSLPTFGKIKERKRRKNKNMMGDKKKNAISDYESVNSSYKFKSVLLIITYFHHFLFCYSTGVKKSGMNARFVFTFSRTIL